MSEWTQKQEESLQLAVGSVRLETNVLTDDIVDIIRESIRKNQSVSETLDILLKSIDQKV